MKAILLVFMLFGFGLQELKAKKKNQSPVKGHVSAENGLAVFLHLLVIILQWKKGNKPTKLCKVYVEITKKLHFP